MQPPLRVFPLGAFREHLNQFTNSTSPHPPGPPPPSLHPRAIPEILNVHGSRGHELDCWPSLQLQDDQLRILFLLMVNHYRFSLVIVFLFYFTASRWRISFFYVVVKLFPLAEESYRSLQGILFFLLVRESYLIISLVNPTVCITWLISPFSSSGI